MFSPLSSGEQIVLRSASGGGGGGGKDIARTKGRTGSCLSGNEGVSQEIVPFPQTDDSED